ncbi:MAG: DUF3795 domain-containing protein [Candidatus Latescibacteria bacterium]|nr:DUF3795 domain-containing protein [Candidatus Latescibacterota bacterium]
MAKINDFIAFCGLYCGACSFKVGFDENNRAHLNGIPVEYKRYANRPLQFCPGCQQLNQCGHGFKECAENHKVAHCGLCDEFPCQRIKDFNNDGAPHHAEVISNLKRLTEIDEQAWLNEQEKQWTCECGAKKSWCLLRCPRCNKQHSKTC